VKAKFIAIVMLFLSGAVLAAEESTSVLDILSQPMPAQTQGADTKVKPATVEPQWVKEIRLSAETASKSSSAQPDVQILLSHLSNKNLEKAFFHWPMAFGNHEFSRTPTGQALLAYLMYKNGLKVTAVELALQVPETSSIPGGLKSLWQEAVEKDETTWPAVRVGWNKAWTEIFGAHRGAAVATRDVDPRDVERLKALVEQSAANSRERAILQWRLSLALALKGESTAAAKSLAELMSAQNNPIRTDLINITAARLLFENGYLDASARYYSLVPKSSDFWIEAQEELAWAEMRRANNQNVLAITKSLIQPVFRAELGPETVMLRSLAQLKVCDYPGVAESLKLFRDRFQPRAKTLQDLQENVLKPEVSRYINLAMKQVANQKKLSVLDLKEDALILPRHLIRDQLLSNLIETQTSLEAEKKIADQLAVRLMNYEALEPGASAAIQKQRQEVESRVIAAREAVLNRIKVLASNEVQEIAAMLQKMHIVETELLQHISLAEKRIAESRTKEPNRKVGTTGSQARDRIWFPVKGEIWFDEIGAFKVDLKKTCQVKSQRGTM